MPTTTAANDHVEAAGTSPQASSPGPESARPLTLSSSSEKGIGEGRDSYRPGGFHPVYIGDVYAERYKVLSKIGYGVYSTVWLVRDLTKPRSFFREGAKHTFHALKILSAESYAEDHRIYEREILKHLRDDGDKSELGYAYICHLVDDFEHQGPNGTHLSEEDEEEVGKKEKKNRDGDEDEADEDEDEDEDAQPKTRRPPRPRADLAFLDDESDSG
ncbi:hypothetical protein V8F33_005055 [Rhypophila sp. PSN 637]